MTDWINRVRSKRKADNRKRRHEALIDNAVGPSERLYAACGWLVSEARQAGQYDDAFTAVMTAIRVLRGEDHDDHNDYAA